VTPLEQVLLNLVFNARDAMPNGGRLAVETTNAGVDAALASTSDVPPGRYVRLVVSDTGIGMPPSVRDHAFEPFFTTKPKGRGTGLGLATVYGIVKQAGGVIDLDSEEGHGTTFACYLPVLPVTNLAAEARDVPAPPPSAPLRSSGHTILLVEDGATLREGLQRILRRADFDVITAASGEEAIAALRRDPERAPALLLTDVMLTGMSGPQLAQILRARSPDLRVLFMSGYTENAFEAIEVARGKTLFLHKPFNAAALLDMISQLVPTH
jgi:two-component system, cell cycle sensor histidine kinase and response regulator CckA